MHPTSHVTGVRRLASKRGSLSTGGTDLDAVFMGNLPVPGPWNVFDNQNLEDAFLVHFTRANGSVALRWAVVSIPLHVGLLLFIPALDVRGAGVDTITPAGLVDVTPV